MREVLAILALGEAAGDHAIAEAVDVLRTTGALKPGQPYGTETRPDGAVMIFAESPIAFDGASFADAPKTIGEARSARSHNAQDWTPRELLVKLLREHDSGECVLTQIVVGFKGDDTQGFWVAGGDRITAVGLASMAAITITGWPAEGD